MKTLLLRIAERDDPQGDYRVELCFEGNGEGWRELPVAVGALPGDLDVARLPVDPDTDQRLGREDLVRLVLDRATGDQIFASVGKHLFDLISRDDVGTAWRALRQSHPREQRGRGEGLRTLFDIAPAELRLLPWELMIGDGKRLFANPGNVCLRARLDGAQRPAADHWPLRLLVVVGSKEDDYVVKAEQEIAGIRHALRGFRGKVEETFLIRPSEQRLYEVFGECQPHIFHFIGHGVSDGAEQHYLSVWDDERDTEWALDRDTIHGDLAATQWAPNLVVINACRSVRDELGTVSDEEVAARVHRGVHSLVGAFMDQGALAVLGMQGDIEGAAAAAFSAALYDELASGRSIDGALVTARLAINRVQPDGFGHRDWCLPCLNLAVLPTDLLPLEYGVPDAARQRIQESWEFQQIHAFVNRGEQRRKLVRSVASAAGNGGNAAPSLMAVIGRKRAGKTWLVYWCLRICSLQGHVVRYVDFRDGGNKNLRDAVRLIRQGPDRPSEVQKGFDDCHFTEFDAVFPHEERDDYLPRLFETLCDGLVAAAKVKPLVLVFDHLDFVVDLEPICERLIDAIGQRQLPGVRMVLVLKESDRDALPVVTRSMIEPEQRRVTVPSLPREEFDVLATEFFLHMESEMPQERLDKLLEAGQFLMRGSTWLPWRLNHMWVLAAEDGREDAG